MTPAERLAEAKLALEDAQACLEEQRHAKAQAQAAIATAHATIVLASLASAETGKPAKS